MSLSPTDISAGPREVHKNYVFVDEHNRHKRLKVMRACEGCRRRKIKCDAATTNTWPCSACTRLKLHCIPPMLQYDREYSSTQTSGLENDQHLEFDTSSSHSGEEDYMHHGMGKSSRAAIHDYKEIDPYRMSPHAHENHGHPYPGLPSAEIINSPLSAAHYQTPVYHVHPPMHVLRHQEQSWNSNPDNEYASALVGSLKIDDGGVAGYISAQGRRLAETPAYEYWEEEVEPNNPTFNPERHEFAVTIRPSDMPTNEEAAEMFQIFFNHIHPYLPIINKAAFYRLWETQREQISPFLLETVFACAGRLTNHPAKGLKWITIASRHLDCFFDVPRLSTVQALLLLLKARESAPQRGYFYRSWMSMVHIIAMARDLHLDSHYELHKQGLGCQESSLECMTRTRVWQACFAYELMICAPQGRLNMLCEPGSVDLTTPLRGSADLEDQEVIVHRNFVHFVRLIHNIRRMSDVHAKLKSSPNWRNDPQFLRSAPSLEQWSYELPQDLRIHVNTDLSQPRPQLPLDSHLVGNLQVYFHLARIMLHRPALAIGKSFSTGGEWRRHMKVCTSAARSICRLEEVTFTQFGMLGLQCMSRGVNFSIYALLTSAMIHLIAATCPDPEFNHDAKEYFSRTMRLLENCIDNSASSEMKGQIEILREAFSADISQPFVLNPSIPFYPIRDVSGMPIDPRVARAYSQAENLPFNSSHPLSPPNSIGDAESKGESPAAVQSLVMLAAGPGVQVPLVEQIPWNPSRLLDNWSTSFGEGGEISRQHHVTQHQEEPVSQGGGSNSYVSAPSDGIANSFVSPGMWQDSVAAATAYSDSGKRTFPFDHDEEEDQHAWRSGNTSMASSIRSNGTSSRGLR